MKPPRCKVVSASTRYRLAVLRNLNYDGESLTLDLQADGSVLIQVTFRRAVGFRALDERDLCEFWPEYPESAGWMFEVEEGGWRELESKRSWFNSPAVIPGLREYFVTDENKCISVLADEPPEIREIGDSASQIPNQNPEPPPAVDRSVELPDRMRNLSQRCRTQAGAEHP